MSLDQRAESFAPLVLKVLHADPEGFLIAEMDHLVVVIDFGALGSNGGGELVLEALARHRRARPRPAPLVNLTIVCEDARRPDARARATGRRMGEYLSAFVCVAEGTGIRAQWVRGILGAIVAFLPRRVPIFVVRSIDEAAALAARELGLDARALADAVHAVRRRALT